MTISKERLDEPLSGVDPTANLNFGTRSLYGEHAHQSAK